MEKFVFRPAIDVPLTIVMGIGFLIHLRHWAHSGSADTTVDLPSRLPQARRRVIGLFAGMLLICWMTKLAVWAILAFLVGVGVFVGAVFGDGAASSICLVITARAIREWAFGFPQLILTPPKGSQKASHSETSSEVLGAQGIVVSTLRPSGAVELSGHIHTAVSDSGELIEQGTEVIVSKREGSGRLRVRPARSAS